ncbi:MULTISPECIES: hypothetical protein [unclassified Pasteurella]|uniref:hypothetical protein n=1 Tax=unclassified Pasteurella TaxID=2621516 RepID=UPI001430DB09|nr:hypothetical protein [Pasteurella sp. 19428wF3_WM03]
MKSVFIFLFYFLSIISVSGFATFLMYHQIEGWGWLVFIDVLLVSMTIKTSDKSQSEG